MENYRKCSKNNKGFTLIEILVAAFIFVIVVTAATNIFLFIGRLQRLMASAFNISDNISAAMEMISREIRMASPRPAQAMFTLTSPSQIAFVNSKNENVVYRLSAGNNQIERSVNGGSFIALTSSNVRVESLVFEIDGNGAPSDNLQPLVKIFLKFSWSGGADTVEKYLQTAVTPRNLDI